MNLEALAKSSLPLEPKASSLGSPADWMINAWGATPSSAGVRVNSYTSLTSGAVHQALTIISNDVATLPLRMVYREQETNRTNLRHAAHKLLNLDAHPEVGANRFRKVMMQWMLLFGNAYAAIERDDVGTPISLWPMDPSKIRLERSSADGPLFYVWYDSSYVGVDQGRYVVLPQRDVFHITNTIGNPLLGGSTMDYMKDTLGSSLAAEQYRAVQWRLSSRPSMIVKKRGKWDEEGRRGFVRQFEVNHQGWANSARIAAVTEDYTFEPMEGITNEQQQLVEQWDKDVLSVSRFFNVPAYRLGININSNRANLEQQSLDYIQSTIQPHLDTWRDEIRRKLVSRRDQDRQTYEITFDDQKLTMIDSATRADNQAKYINMGVLSPNEVRRQEGLDDIDGGDFWLWNKNWGTYGPDEKEEPAPEPTQQMLPFGEEPPEEEAEEEPEETQNRPLTSRIRRKHVHKQAKPPGSKSVERQDDA